MSKKDKQRNKNRAISQAEIQRRAKQAEAAKKKITSPVELVNGFTSDIIELESHARNLEQFIKTRIEMIYKMKENMPEKFAALDDAPFKELQTKMADCLTMIRSLFELVGTLQDMEKFADKMTTIHDNWGQLMEAQIQFQGFAMTMQSIDEQFNKQYQNILTPPQSADLTKTSDGQEMAYSGDKPEVVVEQAPAEAPEEAKESEEASCIVEPDEPVAETKAKDAAMAEAFVTPAPTIEEIPNVSLSEAPTIPAPPTTMGPETAMVNEAVGEARVEDVQFARTENNA